jgi:hypothetical protein
MDQQTLDNLENQNEIVAQSGSQQLIETRTQGRFHLSHLLRTRWFAKHQFLPD